MQNAKGENRRNQLTKAQKLLIMQWIAEGLRDSEIIERAAGQKVPFSILPSTLARTYRTKVTPKVQAAIEQKETSALKQGIAVRENRMELLQELADLLKEKVRKVARGRNAKVLVSLVRELRGVLDDAAIEVGQRKGMDPQVNVYQVNIMQSLARVYGNEKDVVDAEDS